MKSKNRFLAALDIGTDAVKIAVADLNCQTDEHSKVLYVASAGSAKSRGIRKGIVINIDYTVQAIREALTQAESLLGEEITEVLLSISGSHLQGLKSSGVVAIKYGEVTNADLERVFEAASAVAIPFDREIVHILPQDFTIDGQPGIKKPAGISGVRLETSVHIVTGSISIAQNTVKCANRCGLQVKELVLSGICSAYAVTSQEEREQGVCVVDIGAGTADLCIFYNGTVRHTAVIPMGGGHITNDLAAGLRTPIASAEKIKQKYGLACQLNLTGNQRIEIASLGGHASKMISQSDLVKIIEPRLTEILENINTEIDNSQLKPMLTAGVVLTGGTANLGGIEHLGEKIFQMPVRTGSARNIQGLSDFVNVPEYATSLGLINYYQNGAPATLSSAVRKVSVVSRSCKRVANWLQEHF